MARIPEAQAGGRNELVFLDLIAYAEGTSTSRWTKDDGYDIVVDGIDSPHTFSSYRDHPAVLVTVNKRGLKSTAAGRYQQMYNHWPHYKSLLRLPDFGPVSQDRLALQHVRECKALADIHAGHIEVAISKCRNIWASLPGNDYGQRQVPVDELVSFFIDKGGYVA